MFTESQILARKQGIGASESVILFPEIPNSYCTPYKLWMLKTGKIEPDFQINDYQWWGHALEPAIANRYEYETGEKLEYRPDTIIHPQFPFMLCHPDRFVVGKRKLVEIKAVTFDPDKWGEPGTDHVPPEYVLQVQHQLSCTGYDEVDLIAFFLNYRKSVIYKFKRDEELISAIENAVSAFWNNNVLADIAPDLTSLADCKMKFAQKSDQYVEADANTLEALTVLRLVRGRLKMDKEYEDDALRQLFAFIGEKAGIIQDGKVLATWKADKNGKRTFRLSEK